MPRVSESVIAEELSRLLELLGKATGGLNRSGLAEAYRTAHASEIPARTLQRRLERLVVEVETIPQSTSVPGSIGSFARNQSWHDSDFSTDSAR